MDLDGVKRVGIGAAYRAGEIVRDHVGKISRIRKKGAIDLVTEADTASEKAIVETIRAAFPGHAILAEEGGTLAGDKDAIWVIDPLDGTTNFAHQLGLFSISIAFVLEGAPAVGVVLNPVSGELFTAVRSKGAELNGRQIRVSNSESVSESLLVTGFPYNLKEIFGPLIERFSNCLKASRGIRRLGSAAIDLCYLACGRFDGFWEQNLKPWDTAAGWIIATEAGAMVTDFSNQPFALESAEILATNGRIHGEMISLLKLEEG